MELRVVDNVIPMRFRQCKEIPPEVVLHPRAGVQRQMRAIQIHPASASGEATLAKFVVEQDGLTADASHEVAPNFLAEARRVHRIQIVEKGPVRLETVVYGAFVAKGKLSVPANLSR